MPNKIAPRRSFTPNSVPIPATDISQSGELLVNWADGKLFTKDLSGNLVTLTVGGGGGGGSASIVSAATVAGFPATGSASNIYVATDARKIFGWDATNSVYVELGPTGGSGFSWATVPASATASGSSGDLAYDGNYVYVATGSSQWKRAALATWSLDALFANTVLLLNMDGTSGSIAILDSSAAQRTVTVYGDASISTVTKKYGTGSLSLDGTGDYLTFPSSTDFDLGSYYTVEAWVNPASSSLSGAVVHRGQYEASGNLWPYLTTSIRGLGNVMRFYFFATQFSDEQVIDVAASSFPANTWTHVAMVRNGTSGAVYVDGTLADSISGLSGTQANSLPLYIGTWHYKVSGVDTYAGYWNGYIDDLRITKGSNAATGCRYTSNFTPPTAALPGA